MHSYSALPGAFFFTLVLLLTIAQLATIIIFLSNLVQIFV
jgi:hypothetical protein